MKRRKLRKKTKRQKQRGGYQSMGRAKLLRVSQLPLLECIITADWREPGEIIQLCVVRRSPQGDVFTGSCIVDLGCLGVKNAYVGHFNSVYDYRHGLRSAMAQRQEMITCDLNLAAKVIDEAVKYADSLGFRPNRDLKDVLLMMGETHIENCMVEVPLGGEDGQPLFIAGPHDDPERIMRILDRKVGTGNYHFLAPVESGFFEGRFDD